MVLMILITLVSISFGQWLNHGLNDIKAYEIKVNGDHMYAATVDGVWHKLQGDPPSAWTAVGMQGQAVSALLIIDNYNMVIGLRFGDHAIWRTSDAGATWLPSDSGFHVSIINEIDMADYQPDTIFAAGVGIARSVDGGYTWTTVHAADGASAFVEIDPNNNHSIWCGGENIIFQPLLLTSPNLGEDWYSIPINGGGDNACYDVAIRPSQSEQIWVAMEGIIQFSNNGGLSWMPQLVNNFYLYSIEVDPVRSNYLYSTGGVSTGHMLTLFYTHDAGQPWDSTIENSYSANWAHDIEIVSAGDHNTVYLATDHGIFSFNDSKEVFCGDSDGDGIGPNVADLVFLVNYIFKGGPSPDPIYLSDVTGNGDGINVADLVYMVNYLFKGGPQPEC